MSLRITENQLQTQPPVEFKSESLFKGQLARLEKFITLSISSLLLTTSIAMADWNKQDTDPLYVEHVASSTETSWKVGIVVAENENGVCQDTAFCTHGVDIDDWDSASATPYSNAFDLLKADWITEKKAILYLSYIDQGTFTEAYYDFLVAKYPNSIRILRKYAQSKWYSSGENIFVAIDWARLSWNILNNVSKVSWRIIK